MIHMNRRSLDTLRDSDVAITLADPDSLDCQLIFCNHEFEAITGYSEASLLGRNCRFMQCADTSRDDVAKVRSAVQRAATVARCIRNRKKSGKPFWNLLTISPIWMDEKRLLIGCQCDLGSRPAHEDIKGYTKRLTHAIEGASIHVSSAWATISASMQLQAMSVFMMRQSEILRDTTLRSTESD